MSKSYAEKLRDPRWQKKRLEILERDQWTCQGCDDRESTLHVHHLHYTKKDPWDYPDSALVTLCDECHEAEHQLRAAYRKEFAQFMSDWFRGDDLSHIQSGLHYALAMDIPNARSRVMGLAQQLWSEAFDAERGAGSA